MMISRARSRWVKKTNCFHPFRNILFGSGTIQVFTAIFLLWHFGWIHCWRSQFPVSGVSTLMPPPATDLQRHTITQLIQTLVSVGYELACRFRIQLPQVPPEDDTQAFHCTEVCNWRSCTCIRTCTTHRRHQCRRHLGFWHLASFSSGTWQSNKEHGYSGLFQRQMGKARLSQTIFFLLWVRPIKLKGSVLKTNLST